MDILRFITAGSVDDGKSTLIGRLLYDSKSILQDQLVNLQNQSKNKSDGEIDLAILTDGLRAEREQGITIDVAYKYFATPKRKFIIADAPGHIQYTRNMVTGASNTDVIIVLIDARHGVIEQTKRHSLIASILGIPKVIVAINKMDLIGYDKSQFDGIVENYESIAKQLQLKHVQYIPICALSGENIVDKSESLNWYEGPSLLSILETITIDDVANEQNRFQVQYVIRPQIKELHDYRGYAGLISSGQYEVGDKIIVLPQAISTRIKGIEKDGQQVKLATSGQSVILHLDDNIDISRGDTFVKTEDNPVVSNEFETVLCWMDSKALQLNHPYVLQHQSKQVKCMVKAIHYKLNINTLEKIADVNDIALNDVCHISIKTAMPLVVDAYHTLKENGHAILIDANTHATVGACMIS
jgi:sulfate adenylyltransferase subunit 1